MEEPPHHHGSSQPFYFHGLGLTLVTHETACLPSACIPPTIWKSHVIPKELRIKTYNSHVFWNNILILFPKDLSP
jgi:hypothetical protein